MNLRPRETGIATVGVFVVVLVGATVGLRRSTPMWPTALARVQPFTDTIVETGTITTQRLMLYGSTIAGAQAKLVEIAPEGQAVHAGDVLLRFDTSGFDQSRARERASLRQAEADLIRMRGDARLELLRAEDDLESAQQQIDKAMRGLANELDGRGKVEVAAAETAAADAARELAQARTTYEDMKPLLGEGFITRAELDRAAQALSRAEDQQRLATTRRNALLHYERPAATSRAEAELNAARGGLTRQSQAVSARAEARRAMVVAAASRVDEINARVAILDDQIAHATVRAQGPGLVVYRELFFGSEHRKPQLGDEVFPNQPILALPDALQLVIETRIREVDLHKVSTGQLVQVRVDAYPDLRLPATVTLVGALAQEDAARGGTKFFPVTVKLSAADSRLRTGMTARVEIQVYSLVSAVVVPVQAVFEDKGARYVVIAHGGQAERRVVTVAAENESVAAISSGLAAGDTVLLVDPTTSAQSR
jgi:HlyD family secretion protein